MFPPSLKLPFSERTSIYAIKYLLQTTRALSNDALICNFKLTKSLLSFFLKNSNNH